MRVFGTCLARPLDLSELEESAVRSGPWRLRLTSRPAGCRTRRQHPLLWRGKMVEGDPRTAPDPSDRLASQGRSRWLPSNALFGRSPSRVPTS